MKLEFFKHHNRPPNHEADAELHLDGDLVGLRIIGITLWKGKDGKGELYVTFPSRAFGQGAERKYWDYLRGDKAVVKGLKEAIVESYRAALKAGEVHDLSKEYQER